MLLDRVLIIFVKYPQAGFVKTRLAKEIGKEKAARLYRLFVKAILARTNDANFTRFIFYSPLEKETQIRQWLNYPPYLYPQEGDNLGKRLSNAFEFTFKRGAKKAVVIGTDSPTVGKETVIKAFEELEQNDCVIGPSTDGGYYLLGLSNFRREIFDNIEWDTDIVFRQTVNILKGLKLQLSFLDEDFDVDNSQDLIKLRNRLEKVGKIESTYFAPILENLKGITLKSHPSHPLTII